MRVLGLVFVGTSTGQRADMAAFARDVLGLTARPGTADAADGDRYVHLRAPDGHVYELVERRPADAPAPDEA